MSVIHSDVVRRALPELELQCQRSIDAAAALSDAVKEVASRAGLKPAVLSAYVKARVKDKLEHEEQKAEQMQFLFGSFGTPDMFRDNDVHIEVVSATPEEVTPEERAAWAEEMNALVDAEESDDDLDGEDDDILSRAGVAEVSGDE